MRVLVVIFGGLDVEFLSGWPCPNLKQMEWGGVVVDELNDERDVASQITAQLITGKTWRDNGIGDRKRQFIRYRSPLVAWIERRLLRSISKGLAKRRALYHALRWADVSEREFVRTDLNCLCLFDRIPESVAVYVPSYNPEPSWALDRNIFDPRRYPGLALEDAVDLLEKNLAWRKWRFLEELGQEPAPLLMVQFQYLDSVQHLYLDYVSPPSHAAVAAAYQAMDRFAAEIKRAASGKYDRLLFISDNGAALKDGYRPTHQNRPFYSIDTAVGLDRPNLRDFHDLILNWVAGDPNPEKVVDD